MKICDVRQEGMEIEQVLDFLEQLLLNAADMWREAELDQEHRLQQVLFPEKVNYSGRIHRTAAASPLINMSREEKQEEKTLVALTGIE